MKVSISYPKKAQKFFSKNSHILSEEKSDELLLKSVKKLFFNEDVNVDVKKLKGELKHLYRIRYNKIRIIFEVINNEIIIKLIVEEIDFRGDVYK